MRASDVATFGYAENLRAKQWPAFQIGFLKNSSNNENTVKALLFGYRFGKSGV